MKRFIILCLVLVLGFSSCANGNKERLLLFIRHGGSADIEFMVQQEVGVMISMLEEAGFKVIVATDSGEPIKDFSGKSKLLKPDLKLADVRINDYVGIIMPCMAKGRYSQPTPEEISLVKEAVTQGKPIAAQRWAIRILEETGVLEGKKCALLPFGEFEGVIQDSNIITSSYCPYAARSYGTDDGTPELTKLFIETIKD